MNIEQERTLQTIADSLEPITVLTGAGISAESGIPTFRGPEGYWTVGSKVYQPQEMATWRMFTRDPEEVWKWYLYRLSVCRQAQPNAGHLALAAMEKHFEDRFTLITQNVDGLHLRAGNRPNRTYQIHGNIFRMRCSKECTGEIFPVPDALQSKQPGADLTDQDRRLIRCPLCGANTRPHVLWFDETYDETFYRYRSSLETAAQTRLLIIVGTSGATNLPNQIVWEVYRRAGTIIEINVEPTPFTEIARKSPHGFFIQGPSGQALPQLVQRLSA
jgi:NAD-dependent deacetylase